MGWRLIHAESGIVYATLSSLLSDDNVIDVATSITNLTGKLLDVEKLNARGQWIMWA